MKNNRARLCGVAALFATLVISAPVAHSQGNSVVVESKHVAPGQTDVSIGIYISNAVALTAIALPLEFRTVGADNIPHAFTLGPVTIDWNSAGRCYTSVFGPNSPTGIPGHVVKRWYSVRGGTECSGPTSGTYEVASGLHDDHSPDGNLFTAIAVGCDNCGDDIDLDAGMETPGVDAPSLLIQFDVNNVQGRFEIDTCCMRPATHLNFIDRNSSLVPDVAFTKGVITVGTPPNNSVVVESKEVARGATAVSVGVYVSNDIPFAEIVLPLEFRSIESGAYVTGSIGLELNPLGRLYHSAVGPYPTYSGSPGALTRSYYAIPTTDECSGPVSNSYRSATQGIDGVSPDAVALSARSNPIDNTDIEIEVEPGDDMLGVHPPSFIIQFNVTSVDGQFEIDTCCVGPSNHLSYYTKEGYPITPAFTKGIITVGTPPENSVVVESKEVAPGATEVVIGVWISNAVRISDIIIPLEFRSIDSGAFTSGPVTRGFNPAGRLITTAIGPWANNTSTPPSITERYYGGPDVNSCSGPESNTYSIPSPVFDNASPDGFLFMSSVGGDILDEPYDIDPGGENFGVDPPSYYFLFGVTVSPGQFEIDTCCVGPGYHLSYLELWYDTYTPTFTKGIISIGCFCRCHGDPDCNGYLDIVDVVRTVNTAFRGLAPITDQDCTHARTDVDANAMTNVLDVARMIDVVFGGELQDDVFVDPCAN